MQKTYFLEERKKQVKFRMVIENIELMHECSPEYLRTGTVTLI